MDSLAVFFVVIAVPAMIVLVVAAILERIGVIEWRQ